MRRPAARRRLVAALLLLTTGLHGCSDDPSPDDDLPSPVAAVDAGSADEQAHADHAHQPPTAALPSEAAPTDGGAPAADVEPTTEAVEPVPDLTGWMQADGHMGLHTLAWRPIDHDTVPRNVEFSADVLLLRDGALASDAVVQVTGYMPAHGHGLVQMPRCEALGHGRYRVDGLLLHMRGEWQLRFSVVAQRKAETVSFELSL